MASIFKLSELTKKDLIEFLESEQEKHKLEMWAQEEKFVHILDNLYLEIEGLCGANGLRAKQFEDFVKVLKKAKKEVQK